MVNDEAPTETSPLLGNGHTSNGNTVEASDGGLLPNGAIANGKNYPQDEDREGDEEAQTPDANGEAAAQLTGMPDVRKRLKYILPVIGVGVFLSAMDQTIIVSSYGRIGSDLHALNNTSWIATG